MTETDATETDATETDATETDATETDATEAVATKNAARGTVARKNVAPETVATKRVATSTDGGDSPVAGFVPPPYPYDRLDEIAAIADRWDGGRIDLSVGTPADPPPAEVVAAMAVSLPAQGYPASIGTLALRRAAAQWLSRRLGADADPVTEIAVCVGSKEFVASVPLYLKLRSPERDTVLYPAISYPTYEMGATLAGLRAVAYSGLEDIDPADAARALCLWTNSPANPTGVMADLAEVAAWGRERGVLVLSDECYAEYCYAGAATSILAEGTAGMIALHSLSKRDNFAGGRIGFYAGDREIVHYLREVRKHAGLMAPGPMQHAAVVALGDDEHVETQRTRYWQRMLRLREILAAVGIPAEMPDGGFYLWFAAPGGDAWATARVLADRAGIVSSPGEFYGQRSAGYLRVAAVATDDRIELAAHRVGL